MIESMSRFGVENSELVLGVMFGVMSAAILWHAGRLMLGGRRR